MNQKEHVVNAVVLSIGLGVMFQSALVPREETAHPLLRLISAVLEIGLPILLGTLVPDVDTTVGRHRKTLHNVGVLALFGVFPVFFGNLHYVWIGILTHYVLDLVGSKRGLALFYPLEREYRAPIGVRADHDQAALVAVRISGVELGSVAVVVYVADLLAVPLI